MPSTGEPVRSAPAARLAGMTIVLAAGAAILGLLPFVFSPTRTFARGGVWRFIGAGLIVASMMVLFFDVRDMSGGGDSDMSAAAPKLSAAEVSALETLFSSKPL
jgi:hypothetical protein